MSQAFAGQAAAIIKRLGEPVTYIARGGVRHSISAVIDQQFDEYGAAVGNGKKHISLIRAEATHITRGERLITSNGESFVVEDIVSDDGYVIEVTANA